MSEPLVAAQLWLGACVGALLLVVALCVVMAVAWRERPLLVQAGATLLGALTVELLTGPAPLPARVAWLLVAALAGLQLLDLVSHAGALRARRRWLLGACGLGLPLLAALSVFSAWFTLAGLLLWLAVCGAVLRRAWPQSQPWMAWLVPGLVLLLLAGGVLLAGDGAAEDALPVAVLLAGWAACTYVAASWRGRLYGETRARLQARNTIDPLTGLATPLVLAERVVAARHLTRRYGHPSVLMVVHIENLPALAQEFGPETAEAAVLSAASRVRDALVRDGDVAARLAHARIGVLAEGTGPGQAASTIATRILSAGLKEPLAAAPAEYLRFRIALGPVPAEEVPPKLLLHRLNARLDAELTVRSERRIATLTLDDMLVRTDFGTL